MRRCHPPTHRSWSINMNHERMITFYKRRKRRQRLNHLGWVSLAIFAAMVATITILLL